MSDRKYAAPDKNTGFNVNVDPLAEATQMHLTAKQERVVEIALDHLDELDEDARRPVEYAANVLTYMGRVAKSDINMMVGALKTHLRQAHVLTTAERNELLDVQED